MQNRNETKSHGPYNSDSMGLGLVIGKDPQELFFISALMVCFCSIYRLYQDSIFIYHHIGDLYASSNTSGDTLRRLFVIIAFIALIGFLASNPLGWASSTLVILFILVIFAYAAVSQLNEVISNLPSSKTNPSM